MSEQTIAPYGEWESPITATMLAEAGRSVGFAGLAGDRVWWSELRPDQAGRMTVMAAGPDGEEIDLLPVPWNARSRVHEYGGVSWIAVPAGDAFALVFAHYDDQRVYRLDPGAQEPVPLTPEPDQPAGLRYADFVLAPGGREILAVRERHRGKEIDRHIVAIGLESGQEVREIVSGSHFLANPRVSPDGRRLAWLAWEHPQMPWDGTELRVGVIDADGTVRSYETVVGGPTEAILQPEWAGDDGLYLLSDRSNWWNLYRLPLSSTSTPGELEPLYPAEEEFGSPLWQLGSRSYAVLPDGRLLVTHGTGTHRLGVLDPETGELTDFDLPYAYYAPTVRVSGTTAVLSAGGPTTPLSILRVDTGTGSVEVVCRSLDPGRLPDPAYLPVPESTTLYGEDGRDVHVHIYPPSNPRFTAPESEKPPYVVFVHGGPTASSPAVLSSLSKAYFTSRGIGVLDVDYGGSSGYGRAYRERLRGQWGVVDVEDCEIAARALAERGDADPRRLAIRGGSAGGWTTLCAVTRSDVFAAGASLFGVTDVRSFYDITHDFESRYLDGLVGPREAEEIARERSPLTHAGRTRCPVLLLQGADDPVVPLQQAEVFRDALVAKGIPHALIVYEGEQHGFRKTESIVHSSEAELSFYGQVMGFRPPGVPAVELSS